MDWNSLLNKAQVPNLGVWAALDKY
jgi:hypothetical protein